MNDRTLKIKNGKVSEDKSKSFTLPGYGEYELGDFIKIIGCDQLKMFSFIGQFGESRQNFPAGGRTRMVHFIGSLKVLDHILSRMDFCSDLKMDYIKPEFRHLFSEKDLQKASISNEIIKYCLRILVLVHDIGHDAHSHVTEKLHELNHHQFGRIKLSKMKSIINKTGKEMCGLRFDYYGLVSSWYDAMDNVLPESNKYKHLEKLNLIVSHKCIGAEKLEYISADRASLGLTSKNNFSELDFDSILNNVQFTNKHGYGFNEKRLISIIHQVEAMVKNDCEIFLNPSYVMTQSALTRAFFYASHDRLGRYIEMTHDEIYELRNMNTSDHDAKIFQNTKSKFYEKAKRLKDTIYGHNFYNQIGALCYKEGYYNLRKLDDECKAVISPDVSEEIIKLLKVKNIKNGALSKIVYVENKIAEILEIPMGDVLIITTQTKSQGEKTLKKMDCWLYKSDGSGMMLMDVLRENKKYQSLVNEYKMHFMIGICVHKDYVDLVKNNSEKINKSLKLLNPCHPIWDEIKNM
jgi:HD superfamily phosphohydrolase